MCPSRASILTGEYSHSTDIYSNDPPHGGFEGFRDRSTVATWLDAAGYRNALIGKYLNGYQHITYTPPGWDDWISLQSGEYYDYRLTHNRVLQPFDHAPGDYSTHVLADHAVQFLRGTRAPFFLYFAPPAPHYPAIPGPGDRWAFPTLRPWRPPDYDEKDVSDKPAWVRKLPHLNRGYRRSIDRFRLHQYRALLAVDHAVGRIIHTLASTGRLRDTMIVYTSDQGIEWGEHRWTSKQDPYEGTVRVPMVVRYDRLLRPAVNGPSTDDHLVLNIDLAPTFAAAAGVSAPGADGASLMPLLRGESPHWRGSFLIEHMRFGGRRIPTYCAVHTDRYAYVVYETGEQELYDLSSDPYELVNRAHDPAYQNARAELRTRLTRLCRPRPPGFDVLP